MWCYLDFFFIGPSIFDGCVHCWGPKNKHYKETSWKTGGLCSQILLTTQQWTQMGSAFNLVFNKLAFPIITTNSRSFDSQYDFCWCFTRYLLMDHMFCCVNLINKRLENIKKTPNSVYSTYLVAYHKCYKFLVSIYSWSSTFKTSSKVWGVLNSMLSFLQCLLWWSKARKSALEKWMKTWYSLHIKIIFSLWHCVIKSSSMC